MYVSSQSVGSIKQLLTLLKHRSVVPGNDRTVHRSMYKVCTALGCTCREIPSVNTKCRMNVHNMTKTLTLRAQDSSLLRLFHGGRTEAARQYGQPLAVTYTIRDVMGFGNSFRLHYVTSCVAWQQLSVTCCSNIIVEICGLLSASKLGPFSHRKIHSRP